MLGSYPLYIEFEFSLVVKCSAIYIMWRYPPWLLGKLKSAGWALFLLALAKRCSDMGEVFPLGLSFELVNRVRKAEGEVYPRWAEAP